MSRVASDSSAPCSVRLLFLDVDGVLHPLGENYFPKYADVNELTTRMEEDDRHAGTEDYVGKVCRGEFMSDNLQCLKDLVDSDAKRHRIVVSSTWRETAPGMRAVREQLKKAGIDPTVIVDSTPLLGCSTSERWREIMQFLKTTALDVESYVILDDADIFAYDAISENDNNDQVPAKKDGTAPWPENKNADYGEWKDRMKRRHVRCLQSVGLTQTDVKYAMEILDMPL